MNRERLKELMNKVSREYPSLDLKHLLPKVNVFTRLLKKDITTEEFNKIYNEILDEVLVVELKRFPWVSYVSEQPYTKLSEVIFRYNRIKICTDIKDNTFKYYPITIDEEIRKKLYSDVLRDIVKIHIETDKSIESLIDKKIEEYKTSIEDYKNVLKNTVMMPYYGTPDYIVKHSKYILEEAKKLDVDTGKLEGLIQELDNFKRVYLVGNKDYSSHREEYKIAYRNLEEIYLQVLELENELMSVNEQKWQNYLTNPVEHDDTNFRYLVHTFTRGFVSPSEMQKACTTLVTNDLLAIPYGTNGLIYDFNKEAVETICTEDAGSWSITKEKFIDDSLLMNVQLPNPELESVFYEYEKTSKLVTPEEVEKVGISNNLKYNDNKPLTYDKCAYTEIFLNKNAKPCGVFYTDDCKNVQEVTQYAKKYSLPVVHLSLQKLRLMNQRNSLLEQTEENNKIQDEEQIEESKKM